MRRTHKTAILPHHIKNRTGAAADPNFLEAMLFGEWTIQELFSGNINKRCTYNDVTYIVRVEQTQVIKV